MGTAGKSAGGGGITSGDNAAQRREAKESGADVLVYNGAAGFSQKEVTIWGKPDKMHQGELGKRARPGMTLHRTDLPMIEKLQKANPNKGIWLGSTAGSLSAKNLKDLKTTFNINKNPKEGGTVNLPGKNGHLIKRGGKFYHTMNSDGSLSKMYIPRKAIPSLIRTLKSHKAVTTANPKLKGKALVKAIKDHHERNLPDRLINRGRRVKAHARRGGRRSEGRGKGRVNVGARHGSGSQSTFREVSKETKRTLTRLMLPGKGGRGEKGTVYVGTRNNPKLVASKQSARQGFTRKKPLSANAARQVERLKLARNAARVRTQKRAKKK
jgi:hypothetical protein